MLSAILCSLSLFCGGDGEDCPRSYLCHCESCAGPWYEPYAPREGDLVYYDSQSIVWNIADALAGTKPPDHIGIVVILDGEPKFLEASPDSVLRVFILDPAARMHGFKGTIHVRRLLHPLTPEQSDTLACFAQRQEGKGYAAARLLLQMTPFRSRGKVRSKILGVNRLDRQRWICSELIVAACIVAGLFDPDQIKANTVYPRNLLNDCVYDLSPLYAKPAVWSPCLPVVPEEPATGAAIIESSAR